MAQTDKPPRRADAGRPSVAIITTCKGRLHHLKQSLPLMLAQQPDELIVVDYSCPDGTGTWVEGAFPQVKLVRVPDQSSFNASRARNHGAAAAAGDWLFFVDADVLLRPEALEQVRPALKAGRFFTPWLKDVNEEVVQAYGTFFCPAADFAAIDGYDEVLEGWGGEDSDLYMRLKIRKLREMYYKTDILTVIDHGDDERNIATGMADRGENGAVNALYLQAKQKISLLRGGNGNLPLGERLELLRIARRFVGPWYKAGARAPLPVRFAVARTRPLTISAQMKVRTETTITVILEPGGLQSPATS
jgi:glycosyltransferase involved in cell wall biosynthesis